METQKMFLAKFILNFLAFYSILGFFKHEKAYLYQRLECARPECWSKYTKDRTTLSTDTLMVCT